MVEALGFESLVIVGGAEHPLASRPSVCTGELAGETFLFSRTDCSYRKIFERILDEQGVRHDNSIELHSVDALKRIVMAGVGLTILPEVAVADEVAGNSLAIVPWTENGMEVASLMIWYKDRWLS